MIIRFITYAALALSILTPLIASSETAEQLQQQIDNQDAQIRQLDIEIAQEQAQLDAVSTKKQTLQNTISGLNLQIKQLNTKIKQTRSQITATQLTIQQLSTNIASKQNSIESGLAGIMESLRRLSEAESVPLSIQLLFSQNVSTAWQEADATATLLSAIADAINTLSKEKQSLEDTRKATEAQKVKLVKQQSTLVAQQGSLSATKSAQTDLLAQTKNQESNYQAILAQKQAAKTSFEDALTNLKTKLQFVVDPSSIPHGGKGILQWPLDSVRVTQYFGNTPFAQSGAYNGKGHNGIDLAATVGTPVKAALSGTVIGTGNTDAVRECYSFGKWIMIKHGNGLSTMYAHFSQIAVSKGDVVKTGDIIGYSGETGYATGPHLHFGVYLTSATEIIPLSQATNSKTPCATAIMPIAPLSAYLNPLNYL